MTSLTYDDKLKKNLMVWACGTNGNMGGEDRGLVGRPEKKKHFEDVGVDGWINLKYIFRKWDWESWTESIWFWIGTRAGLF